MAVLLDLHVTIVLLYVHLHFEVSISLLLLSLAFGKIYYSIKEKFCQIEKLLSRLIIIFYVLIRRGVVTFTTATSQSVKPQLRLCRGRSTGQNPAKRVSEVCDGGNH